MRSKLSAVLLFGACFIFCAAVTEPEAVVVRRLAGLAEQWRARHGARLAAGLRGDPGHATIAESGFLSELAGEGGDLELTYFDALGRVRWAEDPALIGTPLDRYRTRTGVSPAWVARVFSSTAPAVRRVPETPFYEAAIPILAGGEVLGAVDMWFKPSTLEDLLADTRSEPASPRQAAATDDALRASQQFYLSGLIYYQKGDYGRARAEWRKSVELDPGNSDAQAGLRRVGTLSGPPEP